MNHFLYLIGFAACASIVFAVIHEGDLRRKSLYAAKTFGQFIVVSLVLAWIFYFLPW